MKIKTIITALLLLFVFVSIVSLIIRGICPCSSSISPEAEPAKITPIQAEPLEIKPEEAKLPTTTVQQKPFTAIAKSEGPVAEQPPKVIVYYFHSSRRCITCRKFERLAQQVIKTAFTEELRNERLDWQAINVDKPENKHFVEDYQLYTKSIIIAELRNDRQIRWKNLDRIWELVRDEEAFISYVQQEISDYLGAQ